MSHAAYIYLLSIQRDLRQSMWGRLPKGQSVTSFYHTLSRSPTHAPARAAPPQSCTAWSPRSRMQGHDTLDERLHDVATHDGVHVGLLRQASSQHSMRHAIAAGRGATERGWWRLAHHFLLHGSEVFGGGWRERARHQKTAVAHAAHEAQAARRVQQAHRALRAQHAHPVSDGVRTATLATGKERLRRTNAAEIHPTYLRREREVEGLDVVQARRSGRVGHLRSECDQ
jgi:hypothetical protein